MKSILIKLLIGAVVVGAGYYALSQPSEISGSALTTDTKMDSGALTTEADLMKKFESGGNFKCVASIDSKDLQTTNTTLYASGKNIRVEGSVMPQKSPEVKFNMIVIDDMQYMWGDSMPQGMKMKYDKNEFLNQAKNAPQDLTMKDLYTKNEGGMKSEIKYNCTPWSADATYFVPPSNVTFTDMSALMNMGASGKEMTAEDIKKMEEMMKNMGGAQ